MINILSQRVALLFYLLTWFFLIFYVLEVRYTKFVWIYIDTQPKLTASLDPSNKWWQRRGSFTSFWEGAILVLGFKVCSRDHHDTSLNGEWLLEFSMDVHGPKNALSINSPGVGQNHSVHLIYMYICIHKFITQTNMYIPSCKLTWQWKITILCREYIFKWSNFHCYVSLQECRYICELFALFRVKLQDGISQPGTWNRNDPVCFVFGLGNHWTCPSVFGRLKSASR